ncbi:MAG: hypothetical protein C4527_10365 [Candidatus Omnitrophota bacterium]|jgi:hypothetical protein|nr:MAG: hypothetical protein C4527_10365 [Candidatus Omnitrophota bacterium]
MQFDHIGIPTNEKKPVELYVEATRVWITDAHRHPFRVEWLRFEPDSPVRGPLREEPHVGYRVENEQQISELSRGMTELLAPFDAGFAVAGFYRTEDGANIELVWYRESPNA